MALEQETAYFNSHRDQWLSEGHDGEWVVLRGESVLGFFTSLKAAYSAAVAEYGSGTSFFLKEVKRHEDDIETIQRVHRGVTRVANAL